MNHSRLLQYTLVILAIMMVALPASAVLTVSDIYPDSGINNGTVFITDLDGTDLPVDSSVRLTRPSETNITGYYITWVDPTKITCVFDLTGKAAGDWNVVVVNNSDGTEGILTNGFLIVNPPPYITAITPEYGVNNGTVQITNLSGSNFINGATVTLVMTGQPNISATNVNWQSATKIRCRFPLAGKQPGLWDVIVTNPDGQSAVLPGGFHVRYPPPVLSSITPTSGKNNEVIGITDLAGTGFMAGAEVILTKTGEPNITTINGPIVSPTKILCFFDLNGKAAGPWNVVVMNTDGQSGVLPDGFMIYHPAAPAITGIIPASAANTGIIMTNISGSGFFDGAAIYLTKSGEPDITASGVVVENQGMIHCSFDITGAQSGSWDVVVTNDDGQSATLIDGFSITNLAPTITGVTPPSGENTGVALVNVTGTNFLAGAGVTLHRTGQANITGTVAGITATNIACTFNLAGALAGPWNVTVANIDGQSATLTGGFVVNNPAPTVTGVTPPSGVNTGVVPVNVTGTNFLAGAGVTLHRTGQANITGTVAGITATNIACTFNLAGALAGPWNVTVANIDGQSATLTGGFSVTDPAPTVSGITPDFGINEGIVGVINLAGTGFKDGATVKLKKAGQPDILTTGTPVVESPTKILCFFNLTNAAVGKWDIEVTNPDSQSGMLANAFTILYPEAPEVTSITPLSGINTGPIGITDLAGSGFMNGAAVLLNKTGQSNITATAVIVEAPDKITCTFDLSGKVTGPWNIIVTNNDGQSGILTDGFSIEYPAPELTAIVPQTGINNGPVAITNLSGSGFLNGITVSLNRTGQPDIPATSVVVVSSAKITCMFDLTGKAAGLWNVTVMNPDGKSDILVNGFTIENPAPTVTAITPSFGANNGTVFISNLSGTGFLEGASVTLMKNGQSPIFATGVHVISSTKINATLNLSGRAIGSWNVVVTNTDGKSSNSNVLFNITPPAPVANFTGTPTLGTAPLTVQFTDLSTNNPIRWVWDFGDGSQVGVLDKNPVHTYNNPGVYTVTLTAVNTGGSGTLTRTGYITVVKTPVADFSASPTEGNAPLFVRFTDLSDGNPTRWMWKFGDGTFSFQQNPYHVYRSPGTYSVTLTAMNNAGSNTITKTNYIQVRSLPVASFTANRTSGSSPLAVQFTDTSTGAPTSWLWTFGDDGTSTEMNPVHVFNTTGTFTIQLKVTNSAGTSTETKNGYITVSQGLKAEFEYTTSNPDNYAPLTVAFKDTSTGKPVRWSWRFGDGYTSVEKNPIHNYPLPGTYNVTLTVSGIRGSDSTTKSIVVVAPLIPDFYAEPTNGSAPLTVTLNDISVGNIVSRDWILQKNSLNFAYIPNGSKNQVYTINEPGVFTVTMIAKDAYGQTKSKTIPNYITVLGFPP